MSFSSEFWAQKYETGKMGWDIGYPSSPLKSYIDQLRSKSLKILIPGCGNAYEAFYLLEKGFTDVHVLDIVYQPLEELRQSLYPQYQDHLHLHYEDFFEHQGQYDLILEQTFFCALSPDYRDTYVYRMFELLKPGANLAGVLFTFPFDTNGPPFGGSMAEYQERFARYFHIKTMESCYNSIKPRMGNECFFNVIKPA